MQSIEKSDGVILILLMDVDTDSVFFLSQNLIVDVNQKMTDAIVGK